MTQRNGTIFTDAEWQQIEQGDFESYGGRNSPLREEIIARLGNPQTGEILVQGGYAGECYLHDETGDVSLTDSADTNRDDTQASFYTGFLSEDKFPAGWWQYNARVKIRWEDGRWVVKGIGGVAGREFLTGVPPQTRDATELAQIDYCLMRPTNPPSARVFLSGAYVPYSSEWRYLPHQVAATDLIATYASGLTPGQGRAVQIEVDPTDGSITYTAGSAFTDTSRDAQTGAVNHPAAFANYPRGTDPDVFHYGWVKLYYGMQVITEQDILPGAEWISKGGGASALNDLTDAVISSPQNGHVLYYESGAGQWANRYDWEGVKISGPNSVTSVADGVEAKLDFDTIHYDSGGFYTGGGTNECIITGGIWQVFGFAEWLPDSTTTGAGKVRLRVAATWAGGDTENGGQTVLTPSGLADSEDVSQNAVGGGYADTTTEVALYIRNDSGQTININDCWLKCERLRAPA